MAVITSLKLGIVLFFISALLLGCSADPQDELMSALRRFESIYYGESEESGIPSGLERIRNAVANGADPNVAYEGLTSLYVAIMENDSELLTLLIERGADVNKYEANQEGGSPPLLSAIVDVEEISTDIIKALIAAGATVEAVGGHQPPLDAAVEAGSVSTVKLLLEAGANPNGYEDWESPLTLAAGLGYIDIFDSLLAAGAEVQDERELLHGAAGSGNPDMFERVLPLYSGSKEGLQLFQTAAWGLLLDEDEDRQVRAGAKTVMERLRAAGFEPVPDEFTEQMIDAAQQLNTDALKTMLAYGASASSTNKSGESCLMLAIDAASPGKLMESEVGLKGMFDHQDTHVDTIVRLLIDHGADVNARSKHGRTALMYAAASYNVTAVRLLLEQGADRSQVDEKGRDAADLMLTSRLLKEDKGDMPGRMMRRLIGITPEFLQQAREREKEVLVELKSDLAKRSSDA